MRVRQGRCGCIPGLEADVTSQEARSAANDPAEEADLFLGPFQDDQPAAKGRLSESERADRGSAVDVAGEPRRTRSVSSGSESRSAAHTLELDDYEVANLREGLLFLRTVGGDTGDWMGQLLMKLPEVERAPNVSLQEQRRALCMCVGWRAIYG